MPTSMVVVLDSIAGYCPGQYPSSANRCSRSVARGADRRSANRASLLGPAVANAAFAATGNSALHCRRYGLPPRRRFRGSGVQSGLAKLEQCLFGFSKVGLKFVRGAS